MKTTLRILLTSLIVTGILAACSMGGRSPTAQQDSVNTAVAGTQIAGALAQATVNANTLTQMPATPTPGPTVEYVTMTEEELAALIDEAVVEAIAATEQTTQVVYTTTSDDAVTYDEVVYVYDYYYYADYYVEYAEDLLAEYYYLYADLAEAMIAELNAVESELSQMNDTLTQISTTLDDINSTLSQGRELAQATIDQLESAAQQAQTNAQELQAQAQDMMSQLQVDQQNRVNAISQIQANSVPTDRLSALQSGFTFIDTARTAMGDNKLSRDELMNLAQLGANAQAGFQQLGGGAAGGPDLSQLTSKFGEITGQLAMGQMPQARGNMDSFELSLGSRPSPGAGGGLPGGGPGGRP